MRTATTVRVRCCVCGRGLAEGMSEFDWCGRDGLITVYVVGVSVAVSVAGRDMPTNCPCPPMHVLYHA